MMNLNIDDRLVDAFCKCFGEKFRGKITLETSMDNTQEWDSVSFVDLIMTLEEVYDVEFSMDEMAEMTQVSTIVDVLGKKIT
jgi:acyl carrier protein